MAERAAWALWAMAAHVGSMATSTTDGQLMVYDDGAEDVLLVVRDAPRMSLCVPDRRVLDRGTQHHPLSAAVNNRTSHGTHGGTGSIVLVAVAHAEHDSAPMC